MSGFARGIDWREWPNDRSPRLLLDAIAFEGRDGRSPGENPAGGSRRRLALCRTPMSFIGRATVESGYRLSCIDPNQSKIGPSDEECKFYISWHSADLDMAHRSRLLATLLLIIAVVFAAASRSSAAQRNEPTACLYAYEWLHEVRFPLQPDPHAAYSYIVPKLPNDGSPIGFLVDAEFPYAAWFSWTIYGEQARPFWLTSDKDVAPDPGNRNPFLVGEAVFAAKRHYRMLLLPPNALVGPSLKHISNRLTIPNVPTPVVAYRVYQAFSGYNQGGSNGPAHTPFPSIYAINYESGRTLDCANYNGVPPNLGRLPTDTPNVYNLYGTAAAPERIPTGDHAHGEESAHIAPIFDIEKLAGLQSLPGVAYAPEINPDLVTFTRPPLLPGADVSSVPPPDNCSGYLGGSVDPGRVGLIRIPHIAAVFDTAALTSNTTYPDSEGAYTSLTMYGAATNKYDPGDPESTSLADSEFQLDETGGSTIVVWPRHLAPFQRAELFSYARRNGWVLVRGSRVGPLTTANLLFRLKGANPNYKGAFTPAPGRMGVACYFNGAQPGTRWTELENAPDPMSYVASFQNIGNAAPQGVQCETEEVLNGRCLTRLVAYIRATGGQYYSAVGARR